MANSTQFIRKGLKMYFLIISTRIRCITNERAWFIHLFLGIQTVTKNLKCYYLEMYLKYLSCFAKDVTLIFFFFSPGSENNLPFHSAIIFSVF